MHDHESDGHDSQEHGHHDQGHSHGDGGHGHAHGYVDASIASSDRGIWAIKWSFIGLFVTAVLQILVFYFSRSVGLLADTIHNVGDAATAIPLGIAFLFARLKPTKRFPFGYGRVEDLAGIAVVLTILTSAVVAGYEAVHRIIHPQAVGYLWAVVIASIVGFLGNEVVAVFRIKVGKEIGSAALIADGYHARTDGWTSLAVLVGAIGVWLGYPMADPIVGIGITITILFIVWDSVKAVLTRALDGVEPNVVDDIAQTARHVSGVEEVTEVRARWIGHRMHAEVNITVMPQLTVAQAHAIAAQVHRELMHKLQFLERAVIHTDPVGESGEDHHLREEHDHPHNLHPHEKDTPFHTREGSRTDADSAGRIP